MDMTEKPSNLQTTLAYYFHCRGTAAPLWAAEASHILSKAELGHFTEEVHYKCLSLVKLHNDFKILYHSIQRFHVCGKPWTRVCPQTVKVSIDFNKMFHSDTISCEITCGPDFCCTEETYDSRTFHCFQEIKQDFCLYSYLFPLMHFMCLSHIIHPSVPPTFSAPASHSACFPLRSPFIVTMQVGLLGPLCCLICTAHSCFFIIVPLAAEALFFGQTMGGVLTESTVVMSHLPPRAISLSCPPFHPPLSIAP